MRHLFGRIESRGHYSQTALPLYISQNVSCSLLSIRSAVIVWSLTFFSCHSCIDKWFDVNRSCPEHPTD